MLQLESSQSRPSRSNLITAFQRVVARTGRRQATDLHVRRLLCYVRAKDIDGQGAKKSLKQIADRLVLSVSTCRRVIRRAVKHFGLLIVLPQRNIPGGQTYNRYTINWRNVDALLNDEHRENAMARRNKFQRSSGNSSSANVHRLSNSNLEVSGSSSSCTDDPFARAARTSSRATTSHRTPAAINRHQTDILALGLLPLWPILSSRCTRERSERYARPARTGSHRPLCHGLTPHARYDQPPDHSGQHSTSPSQTVSRPHKKSACPHRSAALRSNNTICPVQFAPREHRRPRRFFDLRFFNKPDSFFSTISHRMPAAINRHQTDILALESLPPWPILPSRCDLAPSVCIDQPLDHTFCPSGSDPVRLAPFARRATTSHRMLSAINRHLHPRTK